MAWLVLVFAGFLETAWAVGIKYTEGFSRIVPTTVTIAAMVGSVYLLAFAAKEIPIGTAYAVWVGIGAVGTAIFGIILFEEPTSVGRILCLSLIIAGVIGLKLVNHTS